MEEKYCPKCGAPIEDGAVKCRFCETPIVEGEVILPDRTYTQGDAYGQQEKWEQSSLYNPQSVNNGMSGTDRILAAISYVGILVLAPILLKPDSHFVRFHVNQGLVLFLLDSLIMLVGGMFGGIALIAGILKLVKCAAYVLMVFGILFAVQGREKELPVIGKIRLLR